MPTSDQLRAQANSARFARDWVAAAHLYQKAKAGLPPLAPKRRAMELDGLTELCRGMLAYHEAGRHVDAAAHLERAMRLFQAAGDKGGVHHAAAFAELARARDGEFGSLESARKHLVAANGHFRALRELRPEDATWRGGVVVTDIGMRVNAMLTAVEDEDSRGASARLAELRAVADSIGEDEAHMVEAVKGARKMALIGDLLLLLLRERDSWRQADFLNASKLARQAANITRTMPEATEQSFLVRLADLADATACGFASFLAGEMGAAQIQAARAKDLSVHVARSASEHPRKAIGALARVDDRLAAANALTALVDGRSHAVFAWADTHIVEIPGALGEQLGRDLAELQRAFAVRAWRLSLIATGSALEGLLLHALRCHDPSADCSRVGLAELLDRAARAGLVSQGTRLMSDALREHRNLIHPAVEERKNYRVDMDVAAAALSVLHAVLDDVAKLSRAARG
jgi:hypothetical protein